MRFSICGCPCESTPFMRRRPKRIRLAKISTVLLLSKIIWGLLPFDRQLWQFKNYNERSILRIHVLFCNTPCFCVAKVLPRLYINTLYGTKFCSWINSAPWITVKFYLYGIVHQSSNRWISVRWNWDRLLDLAIHMLKVHKKIVSISRFSWLPSQMFE